MNKELKKQIESIEKMEIEIEKSLDLVKKTFKIKKNIKELPLEKIAQKESRYIWKELEG